MNPMLIFLSLSTGIYLIFATIWDLKSREIYTFPCNILAVMWAIFAFVKGSVDVYEMVAYVVCFVALYIGFNVTKAWGAGDSDLFLLFGSVYLAHIEKTITLFDISGQCIAMALVLLISASIGLVEAKIRKKELKRDSSIAIAPGYAMVIIGVIVGGFIS